MFVLPEDSLLTRWEAVSGAMEQFVQDERALEADVRVGLQFFSLTGTLDEVVECDPAGYADAPIKIESLTETAGPIIDAMAAMTGDGWVPTYPALQGALDYAVQHAATAPERATAVVLVTGALPSQCEDQSIEGLAELAQTAHQEHNVLTFVIAMSARASGLDPVAVTGGTRAARVIDADPTVQEVLDSLLSVATTRLSCRYKQPELPEGSDSSLADETRALLYYPPGAHTAEEAEEIPRLAGAEQCARSEHGGWFFDDPGSPSYIELCPCTCLRVTSGSLEQVFGCDDLLP
jgi:hypothetical protein